MRKYPKYKGSGVDWFGDIPVDWDIIKLKFLTSTITKGTTPSTVGKDFVDEGINYLKVESISDVGTILPEKCSYIDKETHKILNRSQLKERDIVISIAGAIGRVAIIGNDILPANTNQAVGIIRLRKKFNNQKWITYLLNSEPILNHYKLEVVETAQANLSLENVGIVELTNPTLPEQHAIVRFLDYKTGQIDSFIANRQKQIELLKEQKAGIINKAVTKGINPNAKMKDCGIDTLGIIPENWDVMELKFAAQMMRGKFSHRPRNDERLYGGIFPFIQTGDVTKTEKYITAYKQTLNEWGFSVSKLFPKGTVVITIAANIGDIAILDFDACFPDSIVGFYPKKNKTEFLFYLLKTMKEIFLSESIEGTQLNLSVDRLSSIKVAIPDPAEQQNIIDFINKETSNTETLISKYQKQIDLMQEYRTSLISQAVTGKIDVREWQPKK